VEDSPRAVPLVRVMPLKEYKPGSAFSGVIGRTFDQSEPARPAPRRAKPAPNVLFIVRDDTGFGQMGCYGGPIATPNIDALAKDGSRARRGRERCFARPTTLRRFRKAGATQIIDDAAMEFGGCVADSPRRLRAVALAPISLRTRRTSSAASSNWCRRSLARRGDKRSARCDVQYLEDCLHVSRDARASAACELIQTVAIT